MWFGFCFGLLFIFVCVCSLFFFFFGGGVVVFSQHIISLTYCR